MRIVFNVQVGIDVLSYKEAGKVLDKITEGIEKAIENKGEYDLQSFETQHRQIRRYTAANMPMMAEGAEKASDYPR